MTEEALIVALGYWERNYRPSKKEVKAFLNSIKNVGGGCEVYGAVDYLDAKGDFSSEHVAFLIYMFDAWMAGREYERINK